MRAASIFGFVLWHPGMRAAVIGERQMVVMRVIGAIAGIVALAFWAQVILGVAVFAVPDRYEGAQSIVLSLLAFAIGVAVPAGVVWLLRELGAFRAHLARRFPARAAGLRCTPR